MSPIIYKDTNGKFLGAYREDLMKFIPAELIADDSYTIPKICKECPNHPSNGGSGICHSTMVILTNMEGEL